MSKRLRGPLDTRYWPRVLRGGDVPSHAPELGQCWLWLGQLTDKGYATFKFKDKMVFGHRVSWELHCGPIPEGMCVLHRCDNPPCTNPAHLRLGTILDNMKPEYECMCAEIRTNLSDASHGSYYDSRGYGHCIFCGHDERCHAPREGQQ